MGIVSREVIVTTIAMKMKGIKKKYSADPITKDRGEPPSRLKRLFYSDPEDQQPEADDQPPRKLLKWVKTGSIGFPIRVFESTLPVTTRIGKPMESQRKSTPPEADPLLSGPNCREGEGKR